jgi:TonB family protein
MAARSSWTEMPRDQFNADGDTDAAQLQKTRTDGSGSRRRNSKDAIAVADTIAPPMAARETGSRETIPPRETNTSMNMAFESHGKLPPAPRSNKLLWLAVPTFALAGIAIWQVVERTTKSPPVAAAQPAPTQPATVTPAPASPSGDQPAGRDLPAVRVAGALVDDAPVAVSEPTPAPAATGKTPTKKTAAPATKTAAKVTTAPPTTTTPAPAPAPAPAPTPAPAPQPAVAAPAPPPTVAEPPMAMLSNATVSAIASDHARQLAKCEGTETLHGDVSVSFQIDASGKVVKSQLSSSIKNPKVAGCILKAVQSWQFPKPPSGSAKGVYSIDYQ